jgi:hypothetical protein
MAPTVLNEVVCDKKQEKKSQTASRPGGLPRPVLFLP